MIIKRRKWSVILGDKGTGTLSHKKRKKNIKDQRCIIIGRATWFT
jgi:hypothetical protein